MFFVTCQECGWYGYALQVRDARRYMLDHMLTQGHSAVGYEHVCPGEMITDWHEWRMFSCAPDWFKRAWVSRYRFAPTDPDLGSVPDPSFDRKG